MAKRKGDEKMDEQEAITRSLWGLDSWNNKWGKKRARFVSTFIREFNGKLLDVAGYRGDLKKHIPEGFDYTLVDYQKNEKPWAIQMDLDNNHLNGFKDESFDVIVAVDIFGHLRKPEPLRHSIWRLLKKDGYAILSLNKQKSGHYHKFNEDWLTQKYFHVVAKKGIMFGILPFILQVPEAFASEIFYKVKKK